MSDRTQFDDLVDAANEWLRDSIGWRATLRNFVRGMLFLGTRKHPVYDNKSLSPRQKDAVMLGSDVRRVKIDENGLYDYQVAAMKEAKMKFYNVFKLMFHGE